MPQTQPVAEHLPLVGSGHGSQGRVEANLGVALRVDELGEEIILISLRRT